MQLRASPAESTQTSNESGVSTALIQVEDGQVNRVNPRDQGERPIAE